ncbi:MAG: hypothetical protein WCW56_02195 [Candidatus Paceibacterota bacterium]|jgi:hypothetical protein
MGSRSKSFVDNPGSSQSRDVRALRDIFFGSAAEGKISLRPLRMDHVISDDMFGDDDKGRQIAVPKTPRRRYVRRG